MSGQSDRFQVLRKLPKIRFDEELRGYSRTQVDRVLHSLAPLADEVDDLQARLSDAETRVASAEARLATQPSPASSPAIEAEAATPVTTADFDETLRNTLLLAQRTADQTVKEANAQAERLLEEARSEASSLAEAGRRESDEIRRSNEAARAELEKDLDRERTRRLDEIATSSSERLESIERELTESHDTERQQLLTDIAELATRRTDLTAEIERFESHLAGRREAVRAAIADLEAVTNGDHGLQGEMPPSPAEIPATDPEGFAPVEVASSSLGELEAELDAATAAEAAEPDTVDTPFADEAVAREEVVDEPTNDESVDDGPTYRADDVVAADAGFTDPVPAHPVLEDGATDPSSSMSETSGIMLGELDQGPAPEAVGPATEAVDVLQFDDDLPTRPVEAAEAIELSLDEADDPAMATAEHPVVTPDEATEGLVGAETADSVEAIDETGVLTDAGLPRRTDAPAIERPQWADDVPSTDEAPTPPSDPFLEELRRVTSDEDDTDDDALARFLDGDAEEEADKGGGWFGRRK